MEQKYKRAENLDEKIKEISLPYLEWKVLFLTAENTSQDELVELLQEDKELIAQSLRSLETRGLVELAESMEELPATMDEPIEDEEAATQEEPEEEESVEAVPEEMTKDLVEETVPEVEEEEIFDIAGEIKEGSAEEEAEPDEEVSEKLEDKPEQFEQGEAAKSEMEEFLDEVSAISQGYKEPESEPEADQEEARNEQEMLEPGIEPVVEEEEKEILTDEQESEEELAVEEGEETIEEIEEEDAMAEEEEVIPDVSKKSIMVIDDSIVIRKMIEIALEEEDYRILTATSGKEGMETIEKESPNLIILDMVLPDMNGIDVLKKVKTSHKTPIIMLSGKDAPQLLESAKEIGVDDFLPKPFRDEELVEKVKNLLE